MESMEINYQDEVIKVYPDAVLCDNETDELWASVEWISDGHGNDISDDCDGGHDAWECAYNRIKTT